MIETKSKPCKGVGLAKGHGCGVQTKHRQYGLCKNNCYPDWLFNTENGKLKLQRVILKVQKPRLQFEAVQHEEKERTSLKKALINTKTVVHAFIRERDKGKDCISCGVEWNPDFQAGHHYKCETFETLRFNLDNIAGQCVRCNIFLDGNFDNYALRLPSRIGKERYENLVALAQMDKQFSKVWNLENLKEIRNNLKQLR